MFEIMKIIHIYALMAGAAAGIGNGILIMRLMASDGPPAPMVGEFMATMGKIGRWAIVVLWVTGPILGYLAYGTLALGWLFYIKLVAAAAVLYAVMSIGVVAKRAREAGTPPDLKAMKNLSTTASIAVFVAVVTAVIAFN